MGKCLSKNAIIAIFGPISLKICMRLRIHCDWLICQIWAKYRKFGRKICFWAYFWRKSDFPGCPRFIWSCELTVRLTAHIFRAGDDVATLLLKLESRRRKIEIAISPKIFARSIWNLDHKRPSRFPAYSQTVSSLALLLLPNEFYVFWNRREPIGPRCSPIGSQDFVSRNRVSRLSHAAAQSAHRILRIKFLRQIFCDTHGPP